MARGSSSQVEEKRNRQLPSRLINQVEEPRKDKKIFKPPSKNKIKIIKKEERKQKATRGSYISVHFTCRWGSLRPQVSILAVTNGSASDLTREITECNGL